MQITQKEADEFLAKFFATNGLPLNVVDCGEAARGGARGYANFLVANSTPPDDKDTPKK